MIIPRIAFSLFLIFLVCSCVKFEKYNPYEFATSEESEIIGFDLDRRLADLAEAVDTPDLRHFMFEPSLLKQDHLGYSLYLCGNFPVGSIRIQLEPKSGRLQFFSASRRGNWDPIPPPDPDRLETAISAILGEWPEELVYEGECQDNIRTRCFRWRRVVKGYPVERNGVYAFLNSDGSLWELHVPWAKISSVGDDLISKRHAAIVGRMALEWIRIRWFKEWWLSNNAFTRVDMKLVYVEPDWGTSGRCLFCDYEGVRRLAWVIEYERKELEIGEYRFGDEYHSIRVKIHIDAETGSMIGYDDNLGIFLPWASPFD